MSIIKKSSILLIAGILLGCVFQSPLHAITLVDYTFSPDPAGETWELNHDSFYTWAINWSLPSGYIIQDAELTFRKIYNGYIDDYDKLFVHLLPAGDLQSQTAPEVVKGDDMQDPANPTNQFENKGVQLGVWTDPNDNPYQAIDLTFRFSDVPGLLDTFTDYVSAGYFGFGMDSDCAYFSEGINFKVTAIVPEPSTVSLFFMGILGVIIQYSRKRFKAYRKIVDTIFSSMMLVLLSPVMIIIAILIKTDSPGPVFYKQLRVGYNRRRRRRNKRGFVEKRCNDCFGHPFNIYKFRTMRNDAEANGAVWAKENDSRITKLGAFLRRTHLDEIPQFLNVLKGEMSIIGPRPERPEFVRDLNKSICSYYRRYNINPGITGLAQVRYHYASSIEDTKKKIKYDLLYLKRRCLFMDLRIIFHTMVIVLLAKGAR